MENKFLKTIFLLLIPVFMLVSCEKKEEASLVQKSIEDAVFASGYVIQENEYLISSNVSGILKNIFVTEGDLVYQNQSIALVESNIQNTQLQDAKAVSNDAQRNASSSSTQLTQIQTQISQAQNQLQNDKTNYLRYRDLKTKNSVSQLDLDKAKLQYEASQNNLLGLQKSYLETKDALNLSAERSKIQVSTQKAVLSDYQIKCDNAGKVIQVQKKKGELIRPGETIANIGSGNYLVKLFVSEEDIVKLNLGQKVSVQLNTEPDKTYRATLTKIYPGFNDSEQSYTVEASFDVLPSNLFSGTQLQANIEISTRKNVLVIPTKFIFKGKYVTLENGEHREIKVGSRNIHWTEVISGISTKDKIILKN